jgi:hypothetical protein
MKNFIKKHKNKVFRYWERKRMWTPYDMEQKDPYQLEYGEEECSYGFIVEAVDLGCDWLLGISGDLEADYLEYYLLSDIHLALSETDQEKE